VIQTVDAGPAALTGLLKSVASAERKLGDGQYDVRCKDKIGSAALLLRMVGWIGCLGVVPADLLLICCCLRIIIISATKSEEINRLTNALQR
jgi:hypothetical protein